MPHKVVGRIGLKSPCYGRLRLYLGPVAPSSRAVRFKVCRLLVEVDRNGCLVRDQIRHKHEISQIQRLLNLHLNPGGVRSQHALEFVDNLR